MTTQEMTTGVREVKARDELTRRDPIGGMGSLSALALIHDLRNPIAAIYAGAEMLEADDLSPDQRRRIASSIYRASRQADQLLKNLIKTWRGERESRRLCNLADIIKDVFEVIAAAAQSQMVRLEIDVPDQIEVVIQRTRIESVFLNLLTNALEAVPCGGHLSLRAMTEADSVMIEIDDSGPGIPTLLRNSLFHPFATAKRDGRGLGLMLSRQAVLEQQGELWLGDKSGPGSRFCVRLRHALT